MINTMSDSDAVQNAITTEVPHTASSYEVRETIAVHIEWNLLALRYLGYTALIGAHALGIGSDYTPNLFFVTIGAFLQNGYVHYVLYTRRFHLFLKPFNLYVHLAKTALLVGLTGGEDSPLNVLYVLVIAGYSLYSPTMSRIWSVVWLTAAVCAASTLAHWAAVGINMNYPVTTIFVAIFGMGYLMAQFAELLRKAEHEAAEHAYAVRTSEETLRGILDTTASPIVVFQDNELIVDANEGACELLRCNRDQLLGRRFRAFLFDDGTIPQKLAALRSKGRFSTEVLLLDARGDERSVDLIVRTFIRDGRRFHVGILHDITEEKNFREASLNAQDRLKRLNRELKEVNDLRIDFYRRVAQRIRSPLTAILGYADLLLNEQAGPMTGEQREAVRETRGAARTVLREIDAAEDTGNPTLTAKRKQPGRSVASTE